MAHFDGNTGDKSKEIDLLTPLEVRHYPYLALQASGEVTMPCDFRRPVLPRVLPVATRDCRTALGPLPVHRKSKTTREYKRKSIQEDPNFYFALFYAVELYWHFYADRKINRPKIP